MKSKIFLVLANFLLVLHSSASTIESQSCELSLDRYPGYSQHSRAKKFELKKEALKRGYYFKESGAELSVYGFSLDFSELKISNGKMIKGSIGTCSNNGFWIYCPKIRTIDDSSTKNLRGNIIIQKLDGYNGFVDVDAKEVMLEGIHEGDELIAVIQELPKCKNETFP